QSRGDSREPRSLRGALGVVHPELFTEHVADLADRAAGAKGLAHRREQGRLATSRLPGALDGGGRLVRGALRAHPSCPLALPAVCLRVEPVQLDALRLCLGVPVDADDHALARFDLLRVRERGLIDLLLYEPLLDRGDRSAELVDALDQLSSELLEL